MLMKRASIFAIVAGGVGFSLILISAAMVIPAAWAWGGGDMPPGKGDPATMQVGQVLLYGCAAAAGLGAILILSSAITGVILLMRRLFDS
jgi:hypothetical protein